MQAAAYDTTRPGGLPPGTVEIAAFVNILDKHCDQS
jgi:hypothetical protein